MSASTVTLVGVPLSPFVRKVATCLLNKGMDYDNDPVLPLSLPEGFEKISPLRKIPVLIDGDLVLPDSSVICEYLEDIRPQPAMLPSDPKDRAHARFLEEVADTKLVENTAPIFIERFVHAVVLKQEPDLARAEKAERDTLPPVLDYLESQVPVTGLLFGDYLCTADIALLSPLLNARYGGFEVSSERWPQLAAYLKRVEAHPVVAEVLARERAFAQTLAA